MAAKRTVLIVEDSRTMALLLKTQVEKMGYSVPAILATGKTAVEAAIAQLPDLVIMDIMLSGEMDGIETARMIRSKVDIPVIYLTGRADADTLERVLDTGASGYLVKPFQVQELRAQIETAINKSRLERRLTDSHRLVKALPQAKVFHFRGILAYRSIQADIERCISNLAVPGSIPDMFLVAVNEAVSNALEHGQMHGLDSAVSVTVRSSGSWIVVRVKDDGPGFPVKENLLKLSRISDNPFLEVLYQERGRGIMVMLAATDLLRYNDKGNEVLLAKRVSDIL